MTATRSAEWRAVLNRRRDDPPPRIDLSIPVDRLADDQYCAQLAVDLQNANPDGWSTLKATPKAFHRLPAQPGLYMFVWNPDPVITKDSNRINTPYVLYVGRAGSSASENTIKNRYKGEYSKVVGGDPEILWNEREMPNRNSRFRSYLTIHPLEFWYMEVEDRQLIEDLETRLFNLYSPPLNGSGGPRLRPVRKVNAF